MLKVLLVILLVKLFECTTRMQYRFPNFENHLVEKPILFSEFFCALLLELYLSYILVCFVVFLKDER